MPVALGKRLFTQPDGTFRIPEQERRKAEPRGGDRETGRVLRGTYPCIGGLVQGERGLHIPPHKSPPPGGPPSLWPPRGFRGAGPPCRDLPRAATRRLRCRPG